MENKKQVILHVMGDHDNNLKAMEYMCIYMHETPSWQTVYQNIIDHTDNVGFISLGPRVHTHLFNVSEPTCIVLYLL